MISVRMFLTVTKIVMILHLHICHQCDGSRMNKPLSLDKPSVRLFSARAFRLPQHTPSTAINESLRLDKSRLSHQIPNDSQPTTNVPQEEKRKTSDVENLLKTTLDTIHKSISQQHHTDTLLDSGQKGTQKYTGPGADDIKIFADSEKITGSFDHIWRSTGLCPPDPHSQADVFLLSQDEKLNLAMIGSLPNDAIGQVRIHWLFDLIDARVDDGEPRYDYTHLDDLMDHLKHYDLRPGFEIMGNPGNIFSNLENITQISWWRQLVAQTAQRYVAKYGLDWVSSWNWETWNEPDHHDFDTLNFTLQGFLNYYDACRMGLDDVSPRLLLGGPGGSCRDPHFSKICWALLQHCNNGSSLFTPGKPPRIDFISFHKKGQENADAILAKEIPTVNKIYDQYPALRHVPFMNDEADFEVGWWKGLEWRADVRYAALTVRSVFIHQKAKSNLPHFNYRLMSFDNAFLNYRPSFFDQRTLLARFQINSTQPHQVQFVKKPAYTIMALLSLLGDKLLNYTTSLMDNKLSVLSTCRNCISDTPTFPTSLETKEETSRSDGLETTRNSIQSPKLAASKKIVNDASSEMDDSELLSKKGRRRRGRRRRGKRRATENPEIQPRSLLLDEGNIDKAEIQDWPITDEMFVRGDGLPDSGNLLRQLDSRKMKEDSMTTVFHSKKSLLSPANSSYVDELLKQNRIEFYNSSNGSADVNILEHSPSSEHKAERFESKQPESEGSSLTGSWEATLFISLSNGTAKMDDDGMKAKISLALPKFLVGKVLSVATYRLRGDKKGPYESWLELGSPVEPNRTELAFIRSFEGPQREGPHLVHDVPPYLDFKANLIMPDVLIIHVCHPSKSIPGQLTNVSTVGVTRADVLITWSDALIITRCIWYYEVQQSQTGRDGPYSTISNRNVIDNNFLYSLPQLTGRATVSGWYRVRVVTYWGAAGSFSEPVYHTL